MPELRLDGAEVHASSLTQRRNRAAACLLLVCVTPENQRTALAKYRRLRESVRCQGLRLSGVADLSFLEEFPELLYLEIVQQKRVNTRCLDGLSNLRGLHLESPGAGIDFACFPELEVFVGNWHPDNRNVACAGELRRIATWQFKPRSRDLRDLADIPRLEELELVQVNLASLAGVETLADLRYLDVAYAPKLASLDALASPEVDLRELSLGRAKAVASYSPLAAIRRLRRLKLTFCASMPDLKWTRGMNELDFFSFVETNVENGNLSPLLDLPKLRYAGTLDRRHYSHRFEELNAILNRRLAASD